MSKRMWLLKILIVTFVIGLLVLGYLRVSKVTNYQIGDVLVAECDAKPFAAGYIAALDPELGVVNLGDDTWYYEGQEIVLQTSCGAYLFGRVDAVHSGYVVIEKVP